MGSAVEELVELLDLEQLEVNLFRGVSPDEVRQRVFGGQVAGQALVAAGRTVEHGSVHSLHAYFLRPGDVSIPIVYEVDRIRDGRSFTTRRVVAIQHGRAIFNLQASFHDDEPGFDHQAPRMPQVPDPETLPSGAEVEPPPGEHGEGWAERPRPIDLRYVGATPWSGRPVSADPRQLVWIRADGRLPDDPLLHACVIAYASDYTLLDSTLIPHGTAWPDPGIMMASLDHAMWFHRPFRADEWLLYSQASPSASGGRGLAYGGIFRRDGTLVVSVVQEGLIRPVSPPS
ncbi:MAG TPA: acyl-CoA thioesterase II [Acidimicrobiia bacterium]|nr:acyl-CoA thioesterase II [Acidimicrobiia bacterium]